MRWGPRTGRLGGRGELLAARRRRAVPRRAGSVVRALCAPCGVGATLWEATAHRATRPRAGEARRAARARPCLKISRGLCGRYPPHARARGDAPDEMMARNDPVRWEARRVRGYFVVERSPGRDTVLALSKRGGNRDAGRHAELRGPVASRVTHPQRSNASPPRGGRAAPEARPRRDRAGGLSRAAGGRTPSPRVRAGRRATPSAAGSRTARQPSVPGRPPMARRPLRRLGRLVASNSPY